MVGLGGTAAPLLIQSLLLCAKSLQESIFALLSCLLGKLSKVTPGHKHELELQSAAGTKPVGLPVMQLLTSSDNLLATPS